MSAAISRGWKKWCRWVPVAGICAVTLDAAAQWNSSAWARDPSFRNTNAIWATVHSFVVTNETSPGVFAVQTNVWRSNITFTNWTTGALANSWTMRSLRWTNGVPTNFSYTVSDSQPLVRTNLVQTWQDQIQLDCAMALEERMVAMPYGTRETSFDPKMRLYFSSQDNLSRMKSVLLTYLSGFAALGYDSPQWISESYFSNRVSAGALYLSNAFDMVWLGGSTFVAPYVGSITTNNDITRAAAIPSNYLDSTFYRDLFYTSSVYANVMTCNVYFGSAFGGTTNIIITDCCGNTNVSVSGTNRQVVTVVCTNNSIQPGKTAADYNYYGLRRILTNITIMAHNIQGGDWIAQGGDWRQYVTAASHSTNADAGVDARAVAISLMTNTTTNTTFIFNDQFSSATSNSSLQASVQITTSLWTFSVWSNPFVHEVTWYASATKGGYSGFADMGTGMSNRADLVAHQTVSITSDVPAGLVFATTSTVTLADFAAYNSSSGLVFNAPLWVSRPKPTTNGFRFK